MSSNFYKKFLSKEDKVVIMQWGLLMGSMSVECVHCAFSDRNSLFMFYIFAMGNTTVFVTNMTAMQIMK